MDYHHNARSTVSLREELTQHVIDCRQSAAKWVRRYRELGRAGLRDRSSRPDRMPRCTAAARVAQVEQLRRERRNNLLRHNI